MASGSLAAADVVIIIVYFILVICVGLWSSTKNRGSVGGYFLAGRSMHWMLVGASLFATNIASTHFIGLAGSGAESGIGVAIYEINAIYVLIALGWLFMPVYISSGIYTTPEYMRKRFGGQRIRIYLAVLSLIMYVLTKISADLYSGAIFIEQAVDWNMYVSVCVLLAIAALFTITGGLTAVIWTDFVQTIIMVIGSIWLMIEAFVSVYGFNNMRYKYERAVPNTTFGNPNETCGYPREDYFDLVRSAKTGDIPWPGIIGIVINSIWYWCSDQVIVQRSLAAKNLSYAKGGSVVAGFLKMLPLFIIIFPGMIARILFPDEIACTDPDICRAVCGSPSGCSNIAYPLLVLNLLPTGGRGLMMAVMLSAIMSSLTSIFNSSSTIFTIDIWRKMRKQASHVELMIVGRLAVLVLVVISILWLPVIQNSRESQLFIFVQEISSYFQPPVCAVYILSIFWSRLNEQGAFWSLMIGLVVGTVRMILDFVYPSPSCGETDTRPAIIQLHYLYFAIILFIITAISAAVISLLTPPIDSKHLHRLTWETRRSKEEREDIDTESIVEVKDVSLDADSDTNKHPSVSCAKRSGQWLCGIESRPQGQEAVPPVNTSIEETPRARKLANIGAITVMFCATFMFGFFS